MKALILLIKRELKLSIRNGYVLGLVSLFVTLFFLLSALLAEPNISQISIIFLVALFISNAVFSTSIFQDDYQDSSLQQLVISGHGNLVVVLAKFISYSMISLSISIICAVGLALTYKLTTSQMLFYSSILITTSIITNSVSMLAAALTITLKQNGMLVLLIATPLYIAFLLYSATLITSYSSLHTDINIGWINIEMLFAFCLITVPLAIFSCSYIISEIE